VKFSEIIDQATTLLQHKGPLSYRAVKMQFDLDNDQIDVLREADENARDRGDAERPHAVVQPAAFKVMPTIA
jgi:hypothetical protein